MKDKQKAICGCVRERERDESEKSLDLCSYSTPKDKGGGGSCMVERLRFHELATMSFLGQFLGSLKP